METDKKVEFPEVVMLPVKKIRGNKYNPNFMPADLFNELVRNIDETGMVQPILIAPLQDDPDGFEFEVVDGEHRFDALSVLGTESIPCYVKDLTEDQRKFLTVKMNRLRGKMDMKKFTALVRDLMDRHSLEEVADHMAFTDPTELEELISNARDTLPTPEMKDAFDKAKKDIKTVDDLSLVLNKLFTDHGDTLPANYMVLDFGGKEHLWVRMRPGEFKPVQTIARSVLRLGYTFDSFVMELLKSVPIDKFCQKFKDKLEVVKEEKEETEDIDDLT